MKTTTCSRSRRSLVVALAVILLCAPAALAQQWLYETEVTLANVEDEFLEVTGFDFPWESLTERVRRADEFGYSHARIEPRRNNGSRAYAVAIGFDRQALQFDYHPFIIPRLYNWFGVATFAEVAGGPYMPGIITDANITTSIARKREHWVHLPFDGSTSVRSVQVRFNINGCLEGRTAGAVTRPPSRLPHSLSSWVALQGMASAAPYNQRAEVTWEAIADITRQSGGDRLDFEATFPPQVPGSITSGLGCLELGPTNNGMLKKNFSRTYDTVVTLRPRRQGGFLDGKSLTMTIETMSGVGCLGEIGLSTSSGTNPLLHPTSSARARGSHIITHQQGGPGGSTHLVSEPVLPQASDFRFENGQYRFFMRNDPILDPSGHPGRTWTLKLFRDANGNRRVDPGELVAQSCQPAIGIMTTLIPMQASWGSPAQMLLIAENPLGEATIPRPVQVQDAAAGNNAPSITTQPAPLTVTPGAPATFRIAASGSGTLRYQWFRNGAPLTNTARIKGVKSPTLRILRATAADAGRYSVRITDSRGQVTSREVRLRLR